MEFNIKFSFVKKIQNDEEKKYKDVLKKNNQKYINQAMLDNLKRKNAISQEKELLYKKESKNKKRLLSHSFLSRYYLAREVMLQKMEIFYFQIKENINKINPYKKYVRLFGVAFFIAVFFTLLFSISIGYNVLLNGSEIGVVAEKRVFETALSNASVNMDEWYKSGHLYYESSVIYQRVLIKDFSLLLNEKQCEEKIYSLGTPIFVSGAVIELSGENVVNVTSYDNAKAAWENFITLLTGKQSKEDDGVKVEDIKGKVRFKKSLVPVGSALGVKEAGEYLYESVVLGKVNVDVNNQNLLENNEVINAVNRPALSQKSSGGILTSLNFKAEEFTSGKVVTSKPRILITTTTDITYKEAVAYKTVYKDDPTVFIGQKKVYKDGKKGTKEITATVTYENGKEISRLVKGESITSSPVNKVVLRGTKPLPPSVSTGVFKIPASGVITDFHRSYGSHANGHAVDIANQMGTPIYASDSGVVTLCEYYGSYGLAVMIKHSNGYETLYAHNSKTNVKVGDVVEQGQKIASMGSTGRSTGPHCHFEIHKDGAPVDLAKFFNYLELGVEVKAKQ